MNEVALWLAQAGSLSSVFHTRSVFTAGCPISSGDLFDYTCSNHCPAFQTRNSCLCAFPQTSIRRPLINLGPAVWCGHSGGPPCLRQQSSLICSAQSTVPMGTRTLFQTKRSIHERQAGCVVSPLNRDGRGKSGLCQQMGQCYLNWIEGFEKDSARPRECERSWVSTAAPSFLQHCDGWRLFFLSRLHYDMF